MQEELLSLRLDELPLLQHIIRELGIEAAVDNALPAHGNWCGASIGQVVSLWLCYILSENDHRLQNVEDWSAGSLELLQILSGNASLCQLDFTDDKLGVILSKLSDTAVWNAIETKINGQCLSVYRLAEAGKMPTLRLDAAPMQSHGTVKAGGLLQYGHHKHHADLPQFKVKLSTLDNELTYFPLSVGSMVVSGNESDDGLYIPIMVQSKAALSGVAGYEKENLFIGDNKFAAIRNRAHVVEAQDYYLTPLPLVQLSAAARRVAIENSDKALYIAVEREEGKKMVTIATGFETEELLKYDLDGKAVEWTERRLFVNGTAYARSQQGAFDRKLAKVLAALAALGVSKKGKKSFCSPVAMQAAIDKLLKDNELEAFVTVTLVTTETRKEIRAYGAKPARTDISYHFALTTTTDEAAIEAHKSLLGWQVYATIVPSNLLSFADCVLKYRHQSNIEHTLDSLRNKIAHLVPVFLHKEDRIKGLVNLLLLALKICAVIEYKIADALHKSKTELASVYEGNPKRSTPRPSIKRICKAFKGVSLALIFHNNQLQYAIMTNLQPVQTEILQLLDIQQEVYTELARNIQMFFSQKFISET
jgi:transposase